MKFAAAIAVFLLTACGAKSYSEDLKTAQAYEIYMTGEWYDESSCCGKVALHLESANFKDMFGNKCEIRNVKTIDGNIMVVGGDNCTSDGTPIDNMTLFLTTGKNDKIHYRYSDTNYSGIPVWQALKRNCQEEKQDETKNENPTNRKQL